MNSDTAMAQSRENVRNMHCSNISHFNNISCILFKFIEITGVGLIVRATIHQPYFIPWLGYFSKLAFSDTFIVLDNVNFRKRHYFDRTRIVNMHGEIRWLSLPVGQNFKRKCYEVKVVQPNKLYVDKIIRTIEFSYAKAKFYDYEWLKLRNVLRKPLYKYLNLVDVNISIITNILEYLNIKMPDIHFASKLIEDCKDPTERIIQICKSLKIDSVIVGGGMSLEVHNFQRVKKNGINVSIQDYLVNHPIYEQSRRKKAGFQKGLTILDAILNIGRSRTKEFLIDERYKPVSLIP